MLIGKGLQVGGINDDCSFDFTKKTAEMLAGLVQLFSSQWIFFLLQLSAVFLDGLIGVTGAEMNAVGWTIDFYDPLFTATLGADGSVLGGTESLSFSLSTQNTFHFILPIPWPGGQYS